MLGNWKNIEELEETLNLDELRLIINAIHERELRQMKFFAGLNGVDLEKELGMNSQDKVDEIKARVAARQAGENQETRELRNYFGLDHEIEEEE